MPGCAELSVTPSDGQGWFFFCAWEIKYSNSNRSSRLTEKGYWKSTGKDRNIKAKGTNNVIGTKKTLVFYVGRGRNGVWTPWVIHEYKPATFLRHEVNLHVMLISIFSLIAVSLWMKIDAVEFMHLY